MPNWSQRGADTWSPFSSVKTGSLSQSFTHQSRVKSATFSTGVTGYKYGLAQIDLSAAAYLNESGVAYGVSTITSVNVDTGVITFSLSYPNNVLKGFNGTITCNYVFWN